MVATAFFMLYPMISIFFFNPETDIVLGLDSDNYTPNKNIALFRKQLSLLPALYGKQGDIIAVRNDQHYESLHSLPFFDIAEEKGMAVVRIADLNEFGKDNFASFSDSVIFDPWGWNKEVLKLMKRHNVYYLSHVSSKDIDNLRRLSNRKQTINFFNFIGRDCAFSSPVYMENEMEVRDFISLNPSFCFKAPWSSSGRGIVFSRNTSKEKIFKWAQGILKSQGGIMAENYYNRSIDFASEWNISNGKTYYCGLSLFKADSRGKYCGNLLVNQEKIKETLIDNSLWSDAILEYQKNFIDKYISPFYQGPLGFDMLVTEDGKVNPCVEINIRRTMGHVAIDLVSQMNSPSSPSAKLLKSKFSNGIFSVMDFLK